MEYFFHLHNILRNGSFKQLGFSARKSGPKILVAPTMEIGSIRLPLS